MSADSRWSTDRFTRAALIGILLTFAVVAAFVRQPAITTGEDDAEYVLLGRAIRDLHYRDVADVSGSLHVRYPPAYPAALAAVASVAGERVEVLTLLGVAWSLVTVTLLFLIARRTVGERAALIVCALVAANPWFLASAGRLMSEAQFTALAAIVVWAGLREPRTAANDALAGAAAILAALTRLVGTTLVAALLIELVIRRRFRSAAVLAIVALPTIAAWLVTAASAPERFVGDSYVADATAILSVPRPAVNRPPPQVTPASVPVAIAHRVYLNTRWYVTRLLPYRLAVPTVRQTIVDNVAWVVVITVLVGIGAAALWRRARLVVIVLATYGALLVVWTWSVDRFLEPVIPLVLLAMVKACLLLEHPRRPWLPYAVLTALALLIGGSSVRQSAAIVARMADCDRGNPTTSAGCFRDHERAFFAAARHAAETTPPTAVFLTPKEHAFHYYSGRLIFPMRRALALPASTMLDSLRASGVEYAVIAQLGPVQVPYRNRLRHVCERLEPTAQFDPDVVVFRIRRAGEPPDPRACEAVDKFRPRL